MCSLVFSLSHGTNSTYSTMLNFGRAADQGSMNRILSNLMYALPIMGRNERERRRQKLLRDLSKALGVTL